MESSPKPNPSHAPPRLYLVIVNIQKIANVRALMMTAAAFGCYQVLLVGQDRNAQRDMINKHLEQALEQNKMKLERFSKWKECVDYLQQKSIFLIGVEIDETSKVLDDDYFQNNPYSSQTDIAILMGNEGQGIHPKHLQECQALVRVPQYGVGTASFNVNVAASIVFHRFHQWKRTKNQEEGGKEEEQV
jgi:tRNA G18 (ribose-2'-O)-methylase SpoU